jgi:hypothetical protein
MTKKSPLILAIELHSQAIRKKAHPKIIQRLELRMQEEAFKIREVLERSQWGRDILENKKL